MSWRAARTPWLRARARPKRAARLAHHAQVQGRVRRFEGRLGTVVDDHHLEQRARVGLPFQRRERDGEFAAALVAGHDHRDAERGANAAGRSRARPMAGQSLPRTRAGGGTPGRAVRAGWRREPFTAASACS